MVLRRGRHGAAQGTTRSAAAALRRLAVQLLCIAMLAYCSSGRAGYAAAQELLAAARDFPGITDALAVAALDVRQPFGS